MNQRKPNKWYFLGLAVLLCGAALVSATGTAFARYQTTQRKEATFQVRPPVQVQMGSLTLNSGEGEENTETFDTTAQPTWQQQTDGTWQLTLTVANGTSEEDHATADQTVKLRVIGSAGAGNAQMTIHCSAEEDTVTYSSQVTQITSESTLYTTNGAGWLYTFVTGEGKERTEAFWTLSGKKFTYLTFTITMEGENLTADSLLQPQIVGNLVNS